MCGEANYMVQVTAMWVEALLWGLYIPLFFAALYLLLKQRQNKFLALVSFFSFFFSTAHMATLLTSTLMTPNVVCNSECTLNGTCNTCGAETSDTAFQANIHNISGVIATVFFIINQLIADSVFIWRALKFWNRKYYVAVLPIISLLGATAAGFYQAYTWSILYSIRHDAPANQLSPPQKWYTYTTLGNQARAANVALGMATSTILTILIATRFISTNKDLRRGKVVVSSLTLILESGALITAPYVAAEATNYSSVGGSEIMLGILGQMIGMAPTFLLILVAQSQQVDTTPNERLSRVPQLVFAPMSATDTTMTQNDIGKDTWELSTKSNGMMSFDTKSPDDL